MHISCSKLSDRRWYATLQNYNVGTFDLICHASSNYFIAKDNTGLLFWKCFLKRRSWLIYPDKQYHLCNDRRTFNWRENIHSASSNKKIAICLQTAECMYLSHLSIMIFCRRSCLNPQDIWLSIPVSGRGVDVRWIGSWIHHTELRFGQLFKETWSKIKLTQCHINCQHAISIRLIVPRNCFAVSPGKPTVQSAASLVMDCSTSWTVR